MQIKSKVAQVNNLICPSAYIAYIDFAAKCCRSECVFMELFVKIKNLIDRAP